MSAHEEAPAAGAPIVFLGPTMPLAEARQILPQARFAPPVRCGDVLALQRLHPRSFDIAIIDGCFENVAAVWHKEILWAMRRGHRVYGAASMGALRAAELADCGMIGIGEICEGFRSGRLIDDAEVAVLHRPARLGYTVLTDALVNIRKTLDVAQTERVIGEQAARWLLTAAEEVFYQQRVFSEIVMSFASRDAEVAQLAQWLQARGGLIDAKRQDAEALLNHLSEFAEIPAIVTPAQPAADAASDTIFLRSLECYQACRPFPFDADWLPVDEQLGRAARLLGLRYVLLRHLALAMALLDAGARSRGRAPNDELRRGLREDSRACRQLGEDLLRLFGLYPLQQALAPQVMPILAPLSSALWALNGYLAEAGEDLSAAPAHLLTFARHKQELWGLSAQPQLDAWRARNELVDGRRHLAFWMSALRFEERLGPYALAYHGCFRVDGARPWLLEALKLTGIHDELRQRMGSAASAEVRAGFFREIAEIWRGLGPSADAYAVECDLDGAAEVDGEMARRHANVVN